MLKVRPAPSRIAAAPSEPPTSTRRRLDSQTETERRLTPAVPLFECVPVVALELVEMKNVAMDPRSAFFVSRIDGFSTVSTLFDVCGMSHDESLEILNDLLELGIVVLR
jgi:hypothetical protein